MRISPDHSFLVVRVVALTSVLARSTPARTVTFWATGSESTKELIQKCRSWTPRSRRRVEEFFGVPPLEEQWRKDEDVQATANMTENEELEYFRRRYVDNGDDN